MSAAPSLAPALAPALALEGATFRYPGAERDALDRVTLALEPGRVHWLFGPLGAGCSTLLLAAAGLAPRLTGGTLTGRLATLGADPQAAEGRRALAGRVALVTPSPALQLSGIGATVFEEVAFAPANLGWPIGRIRTAVGEALARFEVAHLVERAPAQLSGGEQQRVVLAAMAALAPALWLLDEPAGALDAAGRRRVAEVLREEAARGAAVVIASEDADLLVDVADRLVVLAEGRVVADGAPRALLAGDAIWTEGPGSTSVAALARGAGLAAPHPLTVAEGVARWSAP
ncbi:MAG TPA: ABC transporter ATP-binding protein [Gemmatimonadales bacterium]|nr:ABC transporter ATP-binding protein [Gemmatimonadales bacterium]